MYRAAMMRGKAMRPAPNAAAWSMKSSERAAKTTTAVTPARAMTSAECGMKAAPHVAATVPSAAAPVASATTPVASATTPAAFREYGGTIAQKAKCANCNGRG